MAYVFHEGSLAVPGDWKDESLNIFKAPEAVGYNLVISRERIPGAVDAEQHVAAQRRIIEENLVGFREHERLTLSLDGKPCVWMEYSWQSPEGPMAQVNVMRVVDSILVSFTFTSARALSDADRGVFRRIVESYVQPSAAAASRPLA